MKIKVAIIGSTGSVGSTALKVISKNKKNFSVILLVCNSNLRKILHQIKIYSPKFIFIKNLYARNVIKKKIKNKIFFLNNLDDFGNFYNKNNKLDKVILAVSSIDGFDYAFRFLNCSKELLIANKESIICGANILIKKASRLNCKITSIDSEHYCLAQSLKNIANQKNIKNIYLTASGGPFLGKLKKDIDKASVRKVLSHPNWIMGKKISVDSANMINKINEVIEAHVLFDIPFDKIQIKIHPQSVIHSIVILKNGLVKIIGHDTTMEIPIRNSLFNNNFYSQESNLFDNKKKITLSFNEIQLKEFPILKIANKIFKRGHAAWILFNIFNDFLVNKFLKKEIFFYQITSNLIKIFSLASIEKMCLNEIQSLADIKNIMKIGLRFINNYEIK